VTNLTDESDIAHADALHREGRFLDAVAAYREILKSAPDHTGALHNLGVVLAQDGQPEEALDLFDRAIGARPDYAHAHANRGGALQSLGRLEDAEAAYGRALTLQPDFYPIRLRRALILLALGRRREALDQFRGTCALRRDENFMGREHASFARTSRLKIAHDAAQFGYLSARGIEPDRFAALKDLYEEALRDIEWPTDQTEAIDIPPPWRSRLAPSYNRPLHAAAAPELSGPAINPALAGAAIEAAYHDDAPGIAVIDELLTQDALGALQGFLLDATIWHDFAHIGGFLAAYLEDGMACPLLLQIADELRRLLPGLLGPHPLQQAWAFKCVGGDKGIDAHADSGALSVNFWITPDDANLEPGTGGLMVHRATPPAEWRLADYHGDMEEIRAFLAQNNDGTLTVPYAQNRVVLFRSDLFHESGPVKFRPGYENHRINITLLFGEERGMNRVEL
jgi:tetratricopeptide (TPR) repeat protein